MKSLLTLFLVLAMALPGFSQQTDTGPKDGSVVANEDLSGPIGDWENMSNMLIFDGDFTSTPNLSTAGRFSDRLRVTGFGFNIPVGSTIEGIEVQIIRDIDNATTSHIQDREVVLIKGGVVQGAPTQNKAVNGPGFDWPLNDPITGPVLGFYGSDVDLWDNTWSVADINSPDFGMAISVDRVASGGGSMSARIWGIQIRVFYFDPALPIQLKSFTVRKISAQSAEVKWVTSGETNVRDYEVQRSGDGNNFATIARLIPESPNSDKENTYTVVDAKPLAGRNFYRLKQTDIDGKFEIFSVRSLTFEPNGAYIRLSQVSSGSLRVNTFNQKGTYDLLIRDTNGRLLQRQSLVLNGTASEMNIPLNAGVKGIVFVNLVNGSENRSFRIFAQ